MTSMTYEYQAEHREQLEARTWNRRLFSVEGEAAGQHWWLDMTRDMSPEEAAHLIGRALYLAHTGGRGDDIVRLMRDAAKEIVHSEAESLDPEDFE